MKLEIDLFSCRSDNYGVLVHAPESGATASIDAPDEDAIIAALQRRGWKLTDIFTTHHHGDHVAGNLALKARYGARITGPRSEKDRIPGIDRMVGDGSRFDFAGHGVEVIETPGHTAGHVCYYLPHDHLLFSADTLFALGCGRLFEKSAEVMWPSLQKLLKLPDDTIVYFGHEYTLANARFAVTIDPDNAALAARLGEIETARAAGLPTAPTRMDIEKATNPFLRPHDPAIRRHLGMENAEDWQVFGEIRRRKDHF
mgnify:CR=1 FL=1